MSDLTIDGTDPCDMYKIYCSCGNIVSLDRGMVKSKKHLKKRVECTVCRNFRISKEIDLMNSLFDGTLDEGYTA